MASFMSLRDALGQITDAPWRAVSCKNYRRASQIWPGTSRPRAALEFVVVHCAVRPLPQVKRLELSRGSQLSLERCQRRLRGLPEEEPETPVR